MGVMRAQPWPREVSDTCPATAVVDVPQREDACYVTHRVLSPAPQCLGACCFRRGDTGAEVPLPSQGSSWNSLAAPRPGGQGLGQSLPCTQPAGSASPGAGEIGTSGHEEPRREMRSSRTPAPASPTPPWGPQPPGSGPLPPPPAPVWDCFQPSLASSSLLCPGTSCLLSGVTEPLVPSTPPAGWPAPPQALRTGVCPCQRPFHSHAPPSGLSPGGIRVAPFWSGASDGGKGVTLVRCAPREAGGPEDGAPGRGGGGGLGELLPPTQLCSLLGSAGSCC